MKAIRIGMTALALLALSAPAAQAQEAGQRAFEIYSGSTCPASTISTTT